MHPHVGNRIAATCGRNPYCSSSSARRMRDSHKPLLMGIVALKLCSPKSGLGYRIVMPAHPCNCFNAGGERCGCRRRHRSQVAATPDQVCRTTLMRCRQKLVVEREIIVNQRSRISVPGISAASREPAPRESATEGDLFGHCSWPAQLRLNLPCFVHVRQLSLR